MYYAQVPSDQAEIQRVSRLLEAYGQITVTAKKRSFSEETVHRPGEEAREHSVYTSNKNFLMREYSLKVFANGYSQENEGHVSVTFRRLNLSDFNGTCFISVIDASENQRFTQSFTFCYSTPHHKLNESEEVIHIEKYITRETLLATPSDLLPSDTLTLKIDIHLESHPENFFVWKPVSTLRHRALKTHVSEDGPTHFLDLDSPLAECLIKESKFFQQMLASSMLETKTKRMKILEEEYTSFEHFSNILMGVNPILLDSVSEVFDMYIVADKYDIPIIMELCSCFLKMYLYDHNIDELIELADEYKHPNLKEIVHNLKDYVAETGRETKNDAEAVIRSKIGDCEWTYRPNTDSPHCTFVNLTAVPYQTSFEFSK